MDWRWTLISCSDRPHGSKHWHSHWCTTGADVAKKYVARTEQNTGSSSWQTSQAENIFSLSINDRNVKTTADPSLDFQLGNVDTWMFVWSIAVRMFVYTNSCSFNGPVTDWPHTFGHGQFWYSNIISVDRSVPWSFAAWHHQTEGSGSRWLAHIL